MLIYPQSLNSSIPPPSPVEPSIDPRVLGPYKFLEYWREPSMIVVPDGGHRIATQNFQRS